MGSISFGQVIPVTGPTFGFPGQVSRMAGNDIIARQMLPTAGANVNFGAACVVIPNASGGGDSYDSIADFIATAFANAGLVALYWAGVAVREVKTQTNWPAGTTPGILQTGSYVPSEMMEVLEKGNAPVYISAGTPQSQGQVYSRVALNTSAVANGTVGDYEATPPSSDFIATTATGTSGTNTVTVASATGVQNGQIVTGAGVAANTSVTNVSGTTITLSNNLTAAMSTTAINFANVVALPNTVFRTGYQDSVTGVAEIMIKIRNVA